MRSGRKVRQCRQDSRTHVSQSHQEETPRDTTPGEDRVTPAQPPVAATVPEHGTATPTPDADAPTIGTGTSIALGCVAGTVLLIVIGLIYILILALF